MATEKLATPLLNLNGSSAENLLEQLSDACSAVGAAREALAKATPHGRDYQLNQSDYQLARKQHEARQIALQAVAEELEAIAISVYNQQAERDARRGR
jgi:phosphopantetheinyl transferase (holo-ACP synthase)